LLASISVLALANSRAPGWASVLPGGGLPWEVDGISPPVPVRPGPWVYFTPDEAASVEAVVDRLIPPDNPVQAAKMQGAPHSSTASLPERLATHAICSCGRRLRGRPRQGPQYRRLCRRKAIEHRSR